MDGQRLRKLRKSKKMTQKELAEVLHLTYHAISSYERNNSEPSDEIKIQIAKYFGVTTDYLLGVSDQKYSYLNNHSILLRLPKEYSDQERKDLTRFLQGVLKSFESYLNNEK